jgi:hypothetical protein
MLKKKIKVKVKLEDFKDLINSGKLKIESTDIELIKSQVEIKPVFKDSTISISKESANNSLKSSLNKHLLIFEIY